MTKEEFAQTVKDAADKIRKECPEMRKGQSVFNETDRIYNVARISQFDYGIDCFYDDTMIEPFLEKCYEIYQMINKN